MNKQKKVWLIISDGLGVRNFGYNGFSEDAKKQGVEITYWNNTVFRFSDLGLEEVEMASPKIHPLTDLYKRAIKEIELTDFINRTGNPVYNSYRFPFKYDGIKSQVKEWIMSTLEKKNNSEKGAMKLRKKIKKLERKTPYYQRCLDQLKKDKPDIVFNSSQRHITSLAPILAATDLNIPTVTFIFSWDNLPKATLVVESDYYFVWSHYMKEQLMFYHPFIAENQIFVTGTPQFDWHVNKAFIKCREEFFGSKKLDPTRKYICFSGDDVVTSPNDPRYLEDLAKCVIRMNQTGGNLGILFRRCPVDFSNRFDRVIEKYKDVLFPINPKWTKMGDEWNFILPEKEDVLDLANICEHSELVINVGSSMVFDFCAHNKPCFYINYDVSNPINPDWSIKKIYKYIHFESMPSPDSVGWINSPADYDSIITKSIEGKSVQLSNTKDWFEKINVQPLAESSDRMVKAFSAICSN